MLRDLLKKNKKTSYAYAKRFPKFLGENLLDTEMARLYCPLKIVYPRSIVYPLSNSMKAVHHRLELKFTAPAGRVHPSLHEDA